MKRSSKTATTLTAERQLKSFIDKFDPEHQKLIRAARKALRKRFPTAHELVYDNYNFFVIGYGPTERPSDCILSLCGAANGIGVCFLYGATLPDPKKILSGSGKQTRFLRLPSLDVLDRPEVKTLIDAAEADSDAPFAKSGKGKLIIRSISAKQRPRRKGK
jgi:hypothetical protein